LPQIPPQQEDPLQAVIRAYQKAHEQGRFDEAVTQRESARSLLDQIPPDSPELGYSVRNVAQIYQNAGLMQQAITIAQQALARATSPEERIQLLQMIADFYTQEQNLLQAVVYRERAVAVLDKVAAQPAVPNSKPVARIYSRIGSFRSGFVPDDSRMWAY
jgi:tetratricopeptide (TPR) repeat protein